MQFANLFGRNGRPARATGNTWRLERLEARETPAVAYAVSASGDSLLRFDTNNPSAATTVSLNGVASGDVLKAIDFNTSTGALMGVEVNAQTNQAQLGTINLSTGAFTPIGATFAVTGTNFGLSANGVTGQLQLVSDANINLSINPLTGNVTTQTSLTGGTETEIAFSNSFAGATASTAYGIDVANDRLVIQGSLNGTPNGAGTGILTGVGTNLGVGDITAASGLDIQSNGTAFAALTVNGQSALYSINLTTGVATKLSNIGANGTVVGDLAIAPTSISVVGTGGGVQAAVKVFDAQGNLVTTINPFPGFNGAVSTAVGDVNNDGTLDVIVGAGAGGGPNVKVYDGTDFHLIANFMAFNTAFTGGVNVAAGDINGDGTDDIIVGAGAGGGPNVKVFSAAAGNPVLADFMAFDPSFTGGVSVAAGDVNGDGKADIAVGAGAGGGPNVKVFSGVNLGPTPTLLQNFMAYDTSFSGGVNVALADLNGDGRADIITGAGQGGGPHVKVFSGVDGSVLGSFLATSASTTGGVRVAAADVNGDGRLDIVTGIGPGFAPTIRTFSQIGTAIGIFDAFDSSFLGGVFVGGSMT